MMDMAEVTAYPCSNASDVEGATEICNDPKYGIMALLRALGLTFQRKVARKRRTTES
jgi:hypothetical protein